MARWVVRLALALAVLALATVAVAATGSVRLSGPHSVKLGKRFTIKISGSTPKPNHGFELSTYENPGPKGGSDSCPNTLTAESQRELAYTAYGRGSYLITAPGPGARNPLPLSERLTAVGVGGHILCVYTHPIGSGKTLFRTTHRWSVHK